MAQMRIDQSKNTQCDIQDPQEIDIVKVKICGITNREDALNAVKLGADVLGFIFASSPRQVSPERVRRIIDEIPPFVKTVGVFVNEEAKTIRELISFCGLDLVQLHGDESADFCRDLMPYTIKALRMRDDSSLEMCPSFQGRLRGLLLDTYADDKVGGTGKTFDWGLAKKAKAYGMPIILSGGLRPSNIEHAVRIVEPYAVDVNSGVEDQPGRKSYTLMEELMIKLRKYA
jgi:phosphoribosylanthranilate isomerase